MEVHDQTPTEEEAKSDVKYDESSMSATALSCPPIRLNQAHSENTGELWPSV
jgi:hypothetical protein